MKASNEFVALMEKRLVDLPYKEEIGKHLLTIQQLRAEADSARERDEQHSKEIRELKERLTLSEGDKVALRGDLDLMREKSKREVESRNAVIRKERHQLAVILLGSMPRFEYCEG